MNRLQSIIKQENKIIWQTEKILSEYTNRTMKINEQFGKEMGQTEI